MIPTDPVRPLNKAVEDVNFRGARDLILPLKAVYFEAIRSGEKLEEFRLRTPYWTRRLEGRRFTRIVLTLGYPARDDANRRLILPWRGMRQTVITHPHFGSAAVEVYAIDVSGVEQSRLSFPPSQSGLLTLF